MEREDGLFLAITGVSDEEDSAFKIEHTQTTHGWWKYHERLQLSYEMNNDVVKVERAVYNSFMLLGDVGGLYGILVPLFSAILGYLNFQKFDNNLAERLFPKEPELKVAQQFVVKEYL